MRVIGRLGPISLCAEVGKHIVSETASKLGTLLAKAGGWSVPVRLKPTVTAGTPLYRPSPVCQHLLMKKEPRKSAKQVARSVAPEAKPEIVLTRWRLIETERGEVHLVGHHAKEGGARVSAPVLRLDVEACRAVTLRGRPYLLKGESEFDLTAAYLLESWREVMGVSFCEDVTDLILAGDVSSCLSQLTRAVVEVESGGQGLSNVQKLTRTAARNLLMAGNPQISCRGRYFLALCGVACMQKLNEASLTGTAWARDWEEIRYNPTRWPSEATVQGIRDYLGTALPRAKIPPTFDQASE